METEKQMKLVAIGLIVGLLAFSSILLWQAKTAKDECYAHFEAEIAKCHPTTWNASFNYQKELNITVGNWVGTAPTTTTGEENGKTPP